MTFNRPVAFPMTSAGAGCRNLWELALASFVLLGGTAVHGAEPASPPESESGTLVFPGAHHPVQLHLYTNGAPGSAGLCNTFSLDAFGERLLGATTGEGFIRWQAHPAPAESLHQLEINGTGPGLAADAGLIVETTAAGPNWRYVALDGTRLYPKVAEQYRRGILFVEPDLFVIHDRIVAREPGPVLLRLHPPSATTVDPAWHDLRLKQPRASLVVQTPADRKHPRNWTRNESTADPFLPGTISVSVFVDTANRTTDLLTVLAVHDPATPADIATKLLESTTAVGARIHRAGLPTLVAFKTLPGSANASLIGFEFRGPVGVSVFVPKSRPPAPGPR